MKTTLIVWILVDVQILDKRVPSWVGMLIPPWPPTDECVEACYQGRSSPYFRKSLAHTRMCAEIPWSFRMAASIADEETYWPASRPILINPSLRIISFDATSQSFQPLPEQILRMNDLLLLNNSLYNNKPIVLEIGNPILVFQVKLIILWLHKDIKQVLPEKLN